MSRWVTPPLAWPRGQIEDQVKSLGPGQGRLHWQRWSSGRQETHHDRFDPAQSPGEAIVHVLLETPIVPIVFGTVALGAVVWAVAASLADESRNRSCS